MLFNSYVFLLAFLPLTWAGYFLLGRLPGRIYANKVFLILASFVFYGWNNPNYVPHHRGFHPRQLHPQPGDAAP